MKNCKTLFSYGFTEWGSDDKTLFYTTPDNLKRPFRLWMHTVGEDVSGQDLLVYEEKDER